MDTPRVLSVRAPAGAAVGLDRAARDPQLLGLPDGVAGLLRLLPVALVGLGSVGLHVAELLARLGVAGLLLVDPARLKRESLLTHHGCLPGDVGREKVEVAGERAALLSPETRVRTFAGPFERVPDAALRGVSWVLLAGDNLAVELAVAQRALHFGLPVVQGSVYGPTLSAQVRALTGTADGDGPCAACLFQAQEWEALDRGLRFRCVGGAEAAAAPAPAPTASPPQLCALAANLAVTELCARALGVPGARGARWIDFCGFNYASRVSPLSRNPACPLEHERLHCRDVRALAGHTPRALLASAGYGDADLPRVTFELGGHRYERLAACRCTPHPRTGTFVALDASTRCPRCRGERAAHPFESWREAPASALAPVLDRSLAELGAAAATSARVRGERGGFVLLDRADGSATA